MIEITTNDLSGNILMLDPTSPEVNRGSYCYLSYLLYSGLSQADLPITSLTLCEEFRISQLENTPEIQDANRILIALWSYPQIDTAMLLNRFLKGKCYFYGYYPLIEALGLNAIRYTEEHLLLGMKHYPYFSATQRFKYDLLSDCDKHIKDDSKRAASGINVQMVPMFTSYGCPMACSFCSATVNQYWRIVLPEQDVFDNLQVLSDSGRTSVHFTDEDFFFDPQRAITILREAYDINPDFQFIALGGMNNVNKFCDELAKCSRVTQAAVWQVLRLVEIGLESVDPAVVQAMGKAGRSGADRAILVKEKCKCPVLWLTVTFFPGETIGSLNATGAFLAEHGFKPERMEERIVTNGTVGGLGQFFQYYEGAGLTMQKFEESGVVLSQRPMRLIPSFIPHSFLKSEFVVDVTALHTRYDSMAFWMDVYGTGPLPEKLLERIRSAKMMDGKWVKGGQVRAMLDNSSLLSYTNGCIIVAILARLNILKEVE